MRAGLQNVGEILKAGPTTYDNVVKTTEAGAEPRLAVPSCHGEGYLLNTHP